MVQIDTNSYPIHLQALKSKPSIPVLLENPYAVLTIQSTSSPNIIRHHNSLPEEQTLNLYPLHHAYHKKRLQNMHNNPSFYIQIQSPQFYPFPPASATQSTIPIFSDAYSPTSFVVGKGNSVVDSLYKARSQNIPSPRSQPPLPSALIASNPTNTIITKCQAKEEPTKKNKRIKAQSSIETQISLSMEKPTLPLVKLPSVKETLRSFKVEPQDSCKMEISRAHATTKTRITNNINVVPLLVGGRKMADKAQGVADLKLEEVRKTKLMLPQEAVIRRDYVKLERGKRSAEIAEVEVADKGKRRKKEERTENSRFTSNQNVLIEIDDVGSDLTTASCGSKEKIVKREGCQTRRQRIKMLNRVVELLTLHDSAPVQEEERYGLTLPNSFASAVMPIVSGKNCNKITELPFASC